MAKADLGPTFVDETGKTLDDFMEWATKGREAHAAQRAEAGRARKPG